MELMMNEHYKGLSSNSKILYSLLLNRTKFSKKNYKKFFDKNGYFVYYSNLQIQKHLGCSPRTATTTLNELEKAGLIKKEYQENGLPLKIYVNDIRSSDGDVYAFFKQPQDEFCEKPYSNSIYRGKPVTRQYKTEEKEVSFDVERAEKKSDDGFVDFGNMKIKRRRTRYTGPTHQF